MSRSFAFTADRGDAGLRLDLVLRRHLTGVDSVARTRLQSWMEAGRVLVNGAIVRRVSSRAALGDSIVVSMPDSKPRLVMSAENGPLDILYEDDDLLALNKPAGLVVHPSYKHGSGTLLNALLGHARAWPEAKRPSLVGRLDKLTSGLVLVAKTAAVHTSLQRAMSAALSEKHYLALVYGRVTKTRGQIDARLERDTVDRRRVIVSQTTGRESVTTFERLASVAAPRTGLSLLRCRLLTGRMHQIRVHLASCGWPIVGDPTYGTPRWSEVDDPTLAGALRAFPRQALHAWQVTFVHPRTGETIRLEAPLPADFEALLKASGLELRRC